MANKATMVSKALDVADRVTALAEGALSGLDLTIGKWPAEFQAIIWNAVAEIASRRAEKASQKSPD